MNSYEGVFILKPDFKDEEIKSACKTITDMVSKNGGSIKKEENWGKRQLAYPVKKFKDGYYYKLDFDAPPSAVAKLEAAYKLDADILRAMITKR
jgi:small subunit ribosomal protein S6